MIKKLNLNFEMLITISRKMSTPQTLRSSRVFILMPTTLNLSADWNDSDENRMSVEIRGQLTPQDQNHLTAKCNTKHVSRPNQRSMTRKPVHQTTHQNEKQHTENVLEPTETQKAIHTKQSTGESYGRPARGLHHRLHSFASGWIRDMFSLPLIGSLLMQ